MPNNRVFYACHAVGVGQGGPSRVSGAQSVAMSTTFDVEPVFQLGQIESVDTLQLSPSVEVTVNRVLTSGGGTIISGDFMDYVGTDDYHVCLSIGDDTSPVLSSPSTHISITGAGVSGVTYNFPVDGTFTEEVNFLARDKALGGCSVSLGAAETATVKTRQYYSSGAPSAVTSAGNLTNVSISASISRENLFRLGEYKAFHNYATLPAEITVDFEVSATSTDGIAIADYSACNGPASGGETIALDICGHTFTMEKCILSNVSYGGGDTGGGNATITFSYTTYNSLTVS
jgi:hypothetical protein